MKRQTLNDKTIFIFQTMNNNGSKDLARNVLGKNHQTVGKGCETGTEHRVPGDGMRQHEEKGDPECE